MTALDEAAKGAKDMDQALAKFGERRKDFEGDLQAMGHAWTSNSGAAKAAVEESIKNMNIGLQKAGKAELKINTKDIEAALKDPAKFRELGSKLSKADMELATAQKAQLDPMSHLGQEMSEINDTLRNFSSKAIHGLLALVGTAGLIATLLATTAGKGMLGGMILNRQGLSDMLEHIPLVGKPLSKAMTWVFGKWRKDMPKTEKVLKTQAAAPAAAGPAAPTTPAPPGGQTPTPAGNALERGLDQINNIPIKKLLMAGGRLAAIAVGIVLLATVVLKISQIITGIAGFNAKKALEAAETTAVVIISAAAIGAAAYGAAMVLETIPWKELKQKAPEIWRGALTLLILTPAIMALAAAIILMVDGIMSITGISMATAIKTAAGIAVVIAATGAIALAVIGASFGLAFLGVLVSMLKTNPEFIPMMFLGAGALLLLTPAMLGLAVAIISMSKGMMEQAGIDMGTAGKTALLIGVIIGAAALIADALIAGVVTLASLGLLGIVALSLMPLLWVGVWAFGVLSSPMVALVGTMYDLSKAVNRVFPPEEAKKAAASLGAIFLAAALIALAVIVAVPVLTALGTIGLLAVLIAALMYIGVFAFNILSAPIVSFIGAMVDFTAQVEKVWDKDDAAEASDLMKSIDDTIVEIGKMMALSAGVLSIFADIFVSSFGLIVGAMWIGVGAFFLMTKPIISFINSMADFVNSISKVWDTDSASDAADLMKSIGDMSKSISDTMFAQGKNLATLGLMIIPILFMIGAMELGVTAFNLLTIPFVKYVTAVNGLADSLGDIVDPSDAEDIVKTCKAVGDITEAVSKAIADVQEKIVPLTKASWTTWLRGGATSQIDDITKALDTFGPLFGALATSISTNIIGEIANLPAMDNSEEAMKKIEPIGKVIEAVGNSMGAITEHIIPLVEAPWWKFWDKEPPIDKIKKAMNTFGTMFGQKDGIIDSIKANIIDVLVAKITDVKGIEEAGKAAKAIANVMEAVPKIVGAINDKIVPMTQASGWFGTGESAADKLGDALKGDGIKKFFTNVSQFCGTIITAILEKPPGGEAIGNPQDVKMAAEDVKGMVEILTEVPKLIKLINKDIKDVMKTPPDTTTAQMAAGQSGNFLAFFQNVAKFCGAILDAILVGPSAIGDPRDVKMAAEDLEGMVKMMPLIPQLVKAINKDIRKVLGEKPDSEAVKTANANRELFKTYFQNVAQFCGTIIDAILVKPEGGTAIGDPRDVKMAAEDLEGMVKMLPLIPQLIRIINRDINNILGEKPDDKAVTAANADRELFKTYFKKVSQFCGGIIDAILVGPGSIGDPRDAQVAAQSLQGMLQLLDVIPGFILGLNARMALLNFVVAAGGGTAGITTGIQKLAGVVKSLELLNKVLVALQAVMATIGGTLGGITGVNTNIASLQKIDFDGLGAVAEKLDKMPAIDTGKLAAALLSTNMTAGTPLGGGTTPLAGGKTAGGPISNVNTGLAAPGGPKKGPAGGSDKPLEEIIGLLGAIRDGINTLAMTMIYTQKTQNKFSEQTIGNTAKEQVQAVNASAQTTSSALTGFGADLQSNFTQQLLQWQKQQQPVHDDTSDMNGTGVVVQPQPTQVATPQSMTDLHTAMQQKYASDQTANVSGPIADMAELTRLQAQNLAVEQEQRELLQKLVDYMKPTSLSIGSGGGEAGKTKNRTIPGRPPRFPDVSNNIMQSDSVGVLSSNFSNA